MTETPFFYLWITASLISSCYAYTWDIKLDWGLFDAKAGDNRFLREEIVYSSTVSNLFLSLVTQYITSKTCTVIMNIKLPRGLLLIINYVKLKIPFHLLWFVAVVLLFRNR